MQQRRRVALVWAGYSVLRLLVFVVPFLAIWGVSGNPTVSAVVAAVIGLALSVILLGVQRNALAGLLGEREVRRALRTDEAVEDALDGGSTAPEPPADGQNASAAARPRP